jgi:cob(I)alamin adenosyltransferase
MKIYTKTGDAGQTGLFAGARVAKDDPRIEAVGAVDELNAALGVARTAELPAKLDAVLATLQNELFDVGAELATPEPEKANISRTTAEQIARLEAMIDQHEAELEPLTQFILPGGTSAAAQLHLARTVCRRAERRVLTLAATSQQPVSSQLLAYLNRLGDLLFVLARSANHAAGQAEIKWQKRPI